MHTKAKVLKQNRTHSPQKLPTSLL